MLNLCLYQTDLFLIWSRQNSSMEGKEVGIVSKSPDWIPLFLLKVKIKQSSDWPNKEYNAVLEHIHQNIMVYPRSKKICIDQWLWKYYCLFRRIQAKPGVSKQVCFSLNTFRGFWGSVSTQKKLAIFTLI